MSFRCARKVPPLSLRDFPEHPGENQRFCLRELDVLSICQERGQFKRGFVRVYQNNLCVRERERVCVRACCECIHARACRNRENRILLKLSYIITLTIGEARVRRKRTRPGHGPIYTGTFK